MLAPVVPYPTITGVRVRIFNLIRQIAKQHRITLVCINELHTERHSIDLLAQYCEKIKVYKRRNVISPGVLYRYSISSVPLTSILFTIANSVELFTQILLEHTYDICHVDGFYIAHNLPSSGRPPMLIVDHAIQFLISLGYTQVTSGFMRSALKLDAVRQKQWQIKMWETAQGCAVVSNFDRELMSKLVPSKHAYVIPNGVDLGHYTFEQMDHRVRSQIVFVGNFRYAANTIAVIDFTRNILPIIRKSMPTTKLLVVGNDPPAQLRRLANGDSVTIVGRVTDIRPYLHSSSVFVCPLSVGSGTRLKLLEAMATGTPIVSTRLGCEGLDVTHRQHLMLAESNEEFAANVIEVLENQPLATSLAWNSRLLVEHFYTWENSMQRLEECYSSVR